MSEELATEARDDSCDLPNCWIAPHTWRAHMDVKGRAAYLGLLAEVERLRAELLVVKNARVLSLLGRSSEQELREDNLRIALAEAQVEVERLRQSTVESDVTRFARAYPDALAYAIAEAEVDERRHAESAPEPRCRCTHRWAEHFGPCQRPGCGCRAFVER